jgi:phosphoribosylglycinamide formyltransferase-1
MQALIDAPSHRQDFEIVGFVTDQPDAQALDRAAAAGIPCAVIALADFADRAAWNVALSEAITTYQPDYVVSAGFMRVIAQPTLNLFHNRIINTHPALLPEFPGAHAVRDALSARATETGCTVHLVDEGVDTGPIIRQQAVAIEPTDTESTLHERIKIVERKMLVETITEISQHGLHIDGRKVTTA